MPAIYNYVTFAQAKQALADRLFDSAMTFWSNSELGVYLQEALRTWNALSSYWRSDFTFPTSQGVWWYDLTDKVNLVNTLRPLTLFDTDLYTAIQYHLLEPPAGVNPWTGVSAQFSANDLINAVQRRRDEVLSVTGCTITRRLVPAVAGRITLPDTVIDVRRIAYFPTKTIPGGYGSGLYGRGLYGVSAVAIGPTATASVLFPEDVWSEQAFNRLYTILPAGTPGTPSVYLMSSQPPISFDVDAAPSFAGNYELLTVETGAPLSAGTPQNLSVPDDWSHVIKWGALADLLSRESNAKDSLRAQYCEQRYRMGLQLLSAAPALLTLRLNNVPLQVEGVREGDLFRNGWQAESAGQPDSAFQSGLNMIALAPVPDTDGVAGFYDLTATVVQNAPMPTLATDPVQIARDDLEVLIDYAQHLASFKLGGTEFMSTMPLLERFLKQASIYGLKLAELGEFTAKLYDLSQRETHINPVFEARE